MYNLTPYIIPSTSRTVVVLKRWIRVVQSLAFNEELADVRAGRPLGGRNPSHRLTPALDVEGLLRVQNRIGHSLFDPDQ